MKYFQVVCAGEFSLFFELPAWKDIILQATLAEPALHHAALAIGALTSSRYHPDMWRAYTPAFPLRHYSMAIQDLCRRFDGSAQSLELAVLTSVVFSYIEFLLGLDSRAGMHIRAGCAILAALRERRRAGSTRYDLLASAMFRLTAQVNCLVAFSNRVH
jgi:Fungal specific transcription factor domain